MAFDEDMKMGSFLKEDEEQHYSLSRLSVCSNYDGDEADDEPSDSGGGGEKSTKELYFSDSDEESTGCHSLPATPPRRRRRRGCGGNLPVNSPVSGDKAYASENEVQKPIQRRRRGLWPEYPPWVNSFRRSNGGEAQSSHGGYGGGVVVVTRPKGGGRALCMDLGEVKACKDLGFELEPSRVSYSGSNMDISSGGNSPIRISSPGDDPKDVKARLKAWAQAVAFVSTTHHQPPSPNSL